MTSATRLKKLMVCLAKKLASFGFVPAGEILARKMRDTLVVLHVQRDRKRSAGDGILVTMNVGISADALRAEGLDSANPIESLPIEKCHWRERLGRLLPASTDVWWALRDDETVRSACEEISKGVIERALPVVEEMASSDALVRAWECGRGQGLTEFERRSNLARLLHALNRKEEATTAIQALEDACRGKSWESSAMYTVRELRKQVNQPVR